ncbi:hypothetical protein MTO96_049147 [Rhipicephalus appendiculatus]
MQEAPQQPRDGRDSPEHGRRCGARLQRCGHRNSIYCRGSPGGRHERLNATPLRACGPAGREAALKAACESSRTEAALMRNNAAQKLLVTNHAFRVMRPTIIATYAFLAVAFYILTCTPYWTLGALFFVMAAVLEAFFVTLYVCTWFEWTLAFLAKLFGLKPCDDDALGRMRSRAERPKPSRLRATVVDVPADSGFIDLWTGPHTKCGLDCQARCDVLHRL